MIMKRQILDSSKILLKNLNHKNKSSEFHTWAWIVKTIS